MAEQYCLRWNNHQRTLISVFDSLQERGCMVDCTLSAEGRSLQAHKVVLSACSPYLEDLLTKHYDKHPILILKDVKFEELKSMLDYMYRGEVNVAQDRLNTFLKAAESLQIKGLSDGGTDPPDSGGTPGATKRTSKGAPVSVRSEQLTVRTTNLNDNTSRDGSISPSLRKRRRRRGSDASDQESSSVEKQSSATPAAGPLASSDMLPTVPTSGPADASALLSIMENETEPTDSGISIASNQVPLQENVIREKDSETLIEPKSEFLDDDTAQDLPMEDDDMFRAGPSHGRSGNFGGDEDVYMAQDSGANAQGAAAERPRRISVREPFSMQHFGARVALLHLARVPAPSSSASAGSSTPSEEPAAAAWPSRRRPSPCRRGPPSGPPDGKAPALVAPGAGIRPPSSGEPHSTPGPGPVGAPPLMFSCGPAADAAADPRLYAGIYQGPTQPAAAAACAEPRPQHGPRLQPPDVHLAAPGLSPAPPAGGPPVFGAAPWSGGGFYCCGRYFGRYSAALAVTTHGARRSPAPQPGPGSRGPGGGFDGPPPGYGPSEGGQPIPQDPAEAAGSCSSILSSIIFSSI